MKLKKKIGKSPYFRAQNNGFLVLKARITFSIKYIRLSLSSMDHALFIPFWRNNCERCQKFHDKISRFHESFMNTHHSLELMIHRNETATIVEQHYRSVMKMCGGARRTKEMGADGGTHTKTRKSFR